LTDTGMSKLLHYIKAYASRFRRPSDDTVDGHKLLD
jgi:hypothetical protein